MPADLHPREIVKLLLQGAVPPRPLLLPIVFALGAKIENLPLASFLGNPTKICNALRQIRAYLRTDGVSCYFDPYLEVEMLGAQVKRSTADTVSEISWPGRAVRCELPEGLASAEDALHGPRISVAVDVIGRLKTMLRDEPLLMAGVTGPLTLAARLTQMSPAEPLQVQDLPPSAVDLSNAVFAGLARTFAEAGANVIFIQENVAPAFSSDARSAWISEIESTCNVIRFYQALPILLLNHDCWLKGDCSWMFERRWNCVVSPLVEESTVVRASTLAGSRVGLALAPSLFSAGSAPSDDAHTWLRETVHTMQAPLITTAGDVPSSIDTKILTSTLQAALRP
jgi:hypothetical protein